MDQLSLLVMGDNHGDTESLKRVIDETADETYDFIVHTGDVTNRGDIEDIHAVEPYFDQLSDRGELIYTWGNREKYGDSFNGEDPIEPGTLLPFGESISVDEQRFTNNPSDVGPKDILLTHSLDQRLIDHFEGRAYFSGHEHTGRYRGRILNSAYLYNDRSNLYGGYFVVEISNELPFGIDFRNVGEMKRTVCPDHVERGTLFQADHHSCLFCHSDHTLCRELARASYYGLTRDSNQERVSESEIVQYAVSLFDNPPDGFENRFASFVGQSRFHPQDPLERAANGQLIEDSRYQ